ncbi:FHA domain-containing protein [Lysobacter enzymogenes]|uniref:Type III secretion protein EscD/YscD/HrpQ family n=3 Tax=Bacteria TaxID=2 RepID=A0AAU9AW05_LYSEN|nr:FHA domain-containing protein [Lysobacter enzymogenes]BAW00294.1 Type III secretion protein EscD/YscD/HrpQ family [Lysobacter enzymogenes]
MMSPDPHATPDGPTGDAPAQAADAVEPRVVESAPAAAEQRNAEIRIASPAISVLRIVSGLHTGGSRPLSAQETVLIGSSGDCDIVLSDPNVAPRHAFLTRMGGTVSLRALDAPLFIDGQTLSPGDPAELAAMQRVDIGGASFAVGAAEDPGWATMLPNLADAARPAKAPMRHLPLIAGLAALSLVSVAIAAAVMPGFEKKPTPTQLVQPLIKEFSIAGGRLVENEDGGLVLSGTVKDAATREMIRKRLITDEVEARLELRTGDDIAGDVREVLRSQGLTTQTRYLGDGDVEVSGHFADPSLFSRAIASRAMQDVAGVRRVIKRDLDASPVAAGPAVAAPEEPKKTLPTEPTRIVKILRDEKPRLVDVDGNEYLDGDVLPDGRTVSGIGSKKVWAFNKLNGMMEEIKVQPLTAQELAIASGAAPAADAATAASPPADAAAASAAKTPAAAAKPATTAPAPTTPPASAAANARPAVAEAPARPGNRQ